MSAEDSSTPDKDLTSRLVQFLLLHGQLRLRTIRFLFMGLVLFFFVGILTWIIADIGRNRGMKIDRHHPYMQNMLQDIP